MPHLSKMCIRTIMSNYRVQSLAQGHFFDTQTKLQIPPFPHLPHILRNTNENTLSRNDICMLTSMHATHFEVLISIVFSAELL